MFWSTAIISEPAVEPG